MITTITITQPINPSRTATVNASSEPTATTVYEPKILTNDQSERVALYDTAPWFQKLAAQLTAEMRSKLDFIGAKWKTEGESREVRLLDYACGQGLVTRALEPYVTQCRGVDISKPMVDRYNVLAREARIPEDAMHAIVGDMTAATEDPALNTPDLHDFDIAAIGMGFHHLENHQLSLRRLSERLKPGGVVLIIDMHGTEEKLPEFARHMTSAHGFDEGIMRGLFEGAGLKSVGYSVMEEPIEICMEGREKMVRTVFLARAEKPE